MMGGLRRTVSLGPRRTALDARWLWAVLLTMGAPVAATALLSSVCILQGRLILSHTQWTTGDPQRLLTPAAWSTEGLPWMVIIWISWAAVWTVMVIRSAARSSDALFAAAPLLAFLAWGASQPVWACVAV
jgi:hypothetical protein